MKLTLPTHFKESKYHYYTNQFNLANKIINDFCHVFQMKDYIDIEFIDEMIVFDDHLLFAKTVSEQLCLDGSSFMKTFCVVSVQKTLYIMTPEYFSKVYPQGIETHSYAKLIAHEIAHQLHLLILKGKEDLMGPIWFYEGFAIFAANQFLGKPAYIPNAHLKKIIQTNDRLFYMYYGYIFRRLMEKADLFEMIGKASDEDFGNLVYQLVKHEETDELEEMITYHNEIEHQFVDQTVRDYVLVLPGGAYSYTSEREAKPVQKMFVKKGYHSGIYYYRSKMLRHPFLLEEGINHLKDLKLNPLIRNVYICGFSAGGHFALQLLENASDLLSGGILAYPVVTTEKNFMHVYSFTQLYGRKLTKEEMNEASLEKHVHESMPPIYIWHTVDDEVVKVENSIFLFEALKKKKIITELHLFPKGRHGLSLANEDTPFPGEDKNSFKVENAYVSSWFNEAIGFLQNIDQFKRSL